MKLAIITYILHKENNNNYYSYEPYVREMNIWIKSIDEIIVVAPKIYSFPKNIETPYVHPKINFYKIPEISLIDITKFFLSLISLPEISFKIWKAMYKADHIHLRCPGNVGLIACIIQIFFPMKPKTVKYAGNWDPHSKQPWSYILQKRILDNTFLSRNIKVLVYGKWPGQSKNIAPFFTFSFTEKEIIPLNIRNYIAPLNFIFVGKIVEGKRPKFAIDLIKELNAKGIKSILKIYGEGDLKDDLINYSKGLKYIHFMGNEPLYKLKSTYISSHFLILPSMSEGWPKVVAEAMFFGCIPISTEVSCIPYMLNYGKRGILVKPKIDLASEKILLYLKDVSKLRKLSKNAYKWSIEYTKEKFEKEIIQFL
tara:strand:+ start:7304 stop:8407 length:1104 start_codon:yes stop_codon:yes gene_type:complete